MVPTSQLVHYELDSIRDDTLLIVVSQSGRSGEIVELIEKLRPSTPVVAFTNDEASPLGKRSNFLLNLHVQPEVSVSTRTYLAPLLLLHLFASVFTGADDGRVVQDLYQSIDFLENGVRRFAEISEQIKNHFLSPSYLTLIGRGYSACTVDAGCLFIKEVAKFPSIPYDAGQFRHGPFEIVGPQFSCMIFAPLGTCYDYQIRLAKDIADKGSKVLVVTNAEQVECPSDILIIRQQYVSQELAGMVNILPVQCFSNIVAKNKGLIVGRFLYGSKITTIQ